MIRRAPDEPHVYIPPLDSGLNAPCIECGVKPTEHYVSPHNPGAYCVHGFFVPESSMTISSETGLMITSGCPICAVINPKHQRYFRSRNKPQRQGRGWWHDTARHSDAAKKGWQK